jgi:hypothetical protein
MPWRLQHLFGQAEEFFCTTGFLFLFSSCTCTAAFVQHFQLLEANDHFVYGAY